MKDEDRPAYIVTLTPTPSDIPPEVRIRQALKVLLRSFGLRCTAIEQAKPPPEPIDLAQTAEK